jgi:hypothetical protein
MKNAKKFMVVPFEEKKTEVVTKPSNTKITETLNNPKILKDNKVKLINQILIKDKNAEFPSQNFDQTFDIGNKDSINNNVHFDQTIDNFNKTIYNPERKSIIKTKANEKSRALIDLNKKIDKLNKSLDKGYLALPPAYSTRNQVDQFSEAPENISISIVPKRKILKPIRTVEAKIRKTIEKKDSEEEPMITSQSGNGWKIYKK